MVFEHASKQYGDRIQLEGTAVVVRAWYGNPSHQFSKDRDAGVDVTDLAHAHIDRLVADDSVWGWSGSTDRKVLIVDSKLMSSAAKAAHCRAKLLRRESQAQDKAARAMRRSLTKDPRQGCVHSVMMGFARVWVHVYQRVRSRDTIKVS